MAAPKPRIADIRLTKNGPSGRPLAEILADKGTSLSEIQTAQKVIYTDLLKKVGLKGCPACLSGIDISIRDRVDILQVDLSNGSLIK